MRGKRLAAAAAFVVLAAVAAVVLGRESGPRTATGAQAVGKNAPAWTRGRELQRGSGEEAEETAAAEDYASRAFPASNVTWEQTRTAIAAAAKVRARGARLAAKSDTVGISPRWDAVGPT